MPHIIPLRKYYSNHMELLRLPYFWEDDTEMNHPNSSFLMDDPKYHVPGLKIFNFHPIHIVLNSKEMDPYNRLKEKINVKNCSLEELEQFRNASSVGTGSMFEELIKQIIRTDEKRGSTISEYAMKWNLM
jgi:hypothetical protein